MAKGAKRLAAAGVRAKQDDKWREEMTALLVLGAPVGFVVLALKFPVYTLAIFDWIGRAVGFTPEGKAGSPNRDSSETTPPAASAEPSTPRGRRRKYPASPFGPVPSKEDVVVRSTRSRVAHANRATARRILAGFGPDPRRATNQMDLALKGRTVGLRVHAAAGERVPGGGWSVDYWVP